jgi:lysozyme
MLNNDIDLAEFELDKALPWWRKLDYVRQEVLLNMMFNMGATRLLGFKLFLAHAEAGEYGPASVEMINSKWAAQVGNRAQRLARQMRTGEY